MDIIGLANIRSSKEKIKQWLKEMTSYYFYTMWAIGGRKDKGYCLEIANFDRELRGE